MRVTYAAAANNTTNGVSLGASGQDIKVIKIIIGQPIASGNITLFNKAVSVGSETTDTAFKYTLPSTLTASHQFPFERVIDFGEGLQLDGGNLNVDQAMQVTVLWKLA